MTYAYKESFEFIAFQAKIFWNTDFAKDLYLVQLIQDLEFVIFLNKVVLHKLDIKI